LKEQSSLSEATRYHQGQLLQLDGLDLSNEAAGVAGKERSHDVEHSVIEATNVQDVLTLRRLHSLVGLQVDANKLRRFSLAACELSLIRNKHRGRGSP
jgi:hypothetical protein